ncbi:MAG: hypothetical protein EOM80_00185 [Erysipelotrichia bacterium]|nr:hypothetical protein [Candidatus Riflebacteria bacterium]NCB37159.1 hypothetical protein [Erysipelotrichia bacterium]
MNFNRNFDLNKLFLIITLSIFLTGCGGGNGGSNDASNLTATLCPGRLSYENAGSENILFASVNSSGVSGWIENQNEIKMPNSDLKPNNAANTSEITLKSVPDGIYNLVYYAGSEQLKLQKTISWTTLPDFPTAPSTPAWDSSSQRLTVNFSGIAAGNVSYYLRLYYGVSPDSMYYQTDKISGGGTLSMHVGQSGDYTPILVADIIENSQTAGTVRYIFSTMSLY